MSEPVVLETNVSVSLGGKVAIEEYGAITSDWHLSRSERWSVPEGWTPEELKEFREKRHKELLEELSEIDQKEFDERFSQSYLKYK
jgi:hypothetical protein